ncbi:MAG: hypothetical protein GXY52_09385 [Chloroflexi bacterium]|nr:hypothetical protein [Chloroflexota bacterium]
MWNKVVLVAAGLACGWAAIHAQAVPPEGRRRQVIQFWAALAIGVGMSTWLALSSLATGAYGLGVFGATALIAALGNARQVNRQPFVLPPHQPERAANPPYTNTILLVSTAEPEGYHGPGYWAQQLRQMPDAPHWLAWPRIYSRIRGAYAATTGQTPLTAALVALIDDLRVQLPEAHLELAWLGEERSYLAQLVAAAEQTGAHLVLALLDDDPRALERAQTLLELVEVPVLQVTLRAVPAPVILQPAARAERLKQLAAGGMPDVARAASEETVLLAGALRRLLAEGSHQAQF